MARRMLSIRFDTELVEYLQERAEKEHRSLSNMIISILMTEKEKGVASKTIGIDLSNLQE